MKQTILYVCLLASTVVSAQYKITKVKDEALNAQEKRQGFQQWGDFKPEAEYYTIFGTKVGPQLSKNHSMVWGWLSYNGRKYNHRYMDGEDIRPLSATGLETQRQLKAMVMQREAETIKKHVDSIYKRSLSDMAHWTSLTVNADPLFLLYYKRMLTPLKNFPDRPETYSQWGFKDEKAFENAKHTGQLQPLQEKLDIIKGIYEKATTLDMPRGKRFLMYHKALIGWREFKRMLQNTGNINQWFLETERLLNDSYKATDEIAPYVEDVQIMESIMRQYKHKF